MAIITLKCKNCGDNMYTDDTKQKAFCGSCGAENLIVQDIVNIHNTTHNTTQNTYHTQQTIQKTIIGKEQNEAEDYIRIGNEFLSLCETGKARENFQKAIDLNPTDYRGRLGLAHTNIKETDFVSEIDSGVLNRSQSWLYHTLNFFEMSVKPHLDKALMLAPNEEKESVKKGEISIKKQLGIKYLSLLKRCSDWSVREYCAGPYRVQPSEALIAEYYFLESLIKKAIEYASNETLNEIKNLAHFSYEVELHRINSQYNDEKCGHRTKNAIDILANYRGPFNCPQVEKAIKDLPAELKMEQEKEAEQQRIKQEKEKYKQEELRKQEEQRRIKQAEEWTKQGLCPYCGGKIGGIFTKKCKSCGKQYQDK